MDVADLFRRLEDVSGVKRPTRTIPAALLYLVAGVSELAARTTGRPALLSWAAVSVMMQERDRSRFDHAKSVRELDVRFRPVEETLSDEIAWFRANGLLPAVAATPSPVRFDAARQPA